MQVKSRIWRIVSKLDQYIVLFRKIQQSWWVKCALGVWAVITIYDLSLSQFIPEEFSKKAPKAWQVAVTTGGLLPWWGWLLILAAILVVSSFEYALRSTRHHRRPRAADIRE